LYADDAVFFFNTRDDLEKGASCLYATQVKSLITYNAFCIVQRATAQSKTGLFHDDGVAEAPPGFQAGWSDCVYFFSLSVHFVCSSGFSVEVFVLMMVHCRIEA
jgi:hypothetical protein